jgi:hypothetical protein
MGPGVLASGEGRRRSDEIREAFSRNWLRVEAEGEFFPVSQIRDSGFSVEAAKAAHLRGCVALYSGRRQLGECLVVMSGRDGDLVHYEVKRWTGADGAARDYVAGTVGEDGLTGG